MKHRSSKLLIALLAGLFALIGTATAQNEPPEWEYLVVSYGTTYFSDPLLEADAVDAVFSKIQLFSEIGITLPQEAISLQRNVDVLGKFGWEMIAVVGNIGGDQQLVFKRPYDAERSALEAERIRAEREELIEAYNASQSTTNDTDTTNEIEETPKPQLVNLDAVEHAQATEERNRRDEATIQSLIRQAAQTSGFTISFTETTGTARNPTTRAQVTVRIRLNVTDAALVAPGQYRSSLVDEAVQEFREALDATGAVASDSYAYCGFRQPTGEATLIITPFIQHDNTSTDLVYTREMHCFDS